MKPWLSLTWGHGVSEVSSSNTKQGIQEWWRYHRWHNLPMGLIEKMLSLAHSDCCLVKVTVFSYEWLAKHTDTVASKWPIDDAVFYILDFPINKDPWMVVCVQDHNPLHHHTLSHPIPNLCLERGVLLNTPTIGAVFFVGLNIQNVPKWTSTYKSDVACRYGLRTADTMTILCIILSIELRIIMQPDT